MGSWAHGRSGTTKGHKASIPKNPNGYAMVFTEIVFCLDMAARIGPCSALLAAINAWGVGSPDRLYNMFLFGLLFGGGLAFFVFIQSWRQEPNWTPFGYGYLGWAWVVMPHIAINMTGGLEEMIFRFLFGIITMPYLILNPPADNTQLQLAYWVVLVAVILSNVGWVGLWLNYDMFRRGDLMRKDSTIATRWACLQAKKEDHGFFAQPIEKLSAIDVAGADTISGIDPEGNQLKQDNENTLVDDSVLDLSDPQLL